MYVILHNIGIYKMKELKGKYCSDCKIMTEDIEEEALDQIYDVLNSPASNNIKIRIMPDVHSGSKICIGYTSTFSDYINPSFVGCDIGCGVETIIFDKILPKEKYSLFEEMIKKTIPTGFTINEKPVFEVEDFLKFLHSELESAYVSGKINHIDMNTKQDLKKWLASISMDANKFCNSIMSLGGGNHFMEYGESSDGSVSAFTVHTGSRNLGIKVESKWSKIASSETFNKNEFKKACEEIKKNTMNTKEIGKKIEELKCNATKDFIKGFLHGDNLKEYLTDMVISQAYAKFNRKKILEKAAEIMNEINGGNVIDNISSVHNYIDMNDMIIRKGAIKSYVGEKMVVPFNMRDGIAICEGQSNADWNFSCSHGSGRKMSRTKAKNTLNMDTFISEMKNVYSTSVDISTIDESPM